MSGGDRSVQFDAVHNDRPRNEWFQDGCARMSPWVVLESNDEVHRSRIMQALRFSDAALMKFLLCFALVCV